MALRNKISAGILGALLVVAPGLLAQEEGRHEVSAQGTGFFTKDSANNGITQRSSNSGGLLTGYRFNFNRWLAASADYGYARNTQQNLTPAGVSNIQANIHQITGALVVKLPQASVFSPYVLGGAGALIFDPTGNTGAFVAGAERQSKAAFVYGGGANYWLTDWVGLRGEYRGFVYKRPDFGLASLNSDATTHTAQPSAGIVLRF
jgi:opacity protein-like surface antigen